MRYWENKKEHQISLGPYPDLSLRDARKFTQEAFLKSCSERRNAAKPNSDSLSQARQAQAKQLAQGLGGRIAMIDTENGSGDLYSDICDYDVQTLSAPYSVQKYLAAIHEAEEEGYDILIIDSLSHAWSGEGGLLDVHSQLTRNMKNGNSYTAWNKITPWHNRLIESMLASSCHIIATMRTKTEYAMIQNEKGKTEIQKVGLAPVQRDGMDYEFTIVFDLSMEHTVTVSKDRTSLFDRQVFSITQDTGKIIRKWLDSGADVPPDSQDNRNKINRLYRTYLDLFGQDSGAAQAAMQKVTGGRASKDWTDEDMKNLSDDLMLRMQKKGVLDGSDI
ncbi:MAG: AAA family ATPase [Synergistaceae bacterium]|nr:AAA family ATPase [Synergistaceae bacterium]